jgi:hypothetical protein
MTRLNCLAYIIGMAVVAPLCEPAETRPDFSGTWEMDATRSDSANSSAATGPVTVIIKQTRDEISVETRQQGQTETLVYKLDGSTTEKPAQDNGPFQWRAEWAAGKLITETHRNVNRATVTIRETRSMDAKRKEMQVDRTLMVQHGYNMRGAKNYASGTDLFVKSR